MKALKSPKLTPEQLSVIKAHDKSEMFKAAQENIISCRYSAGTQLEASEPWEAHKSVSFIYAPAGTSTITAGFRKDETITCTIEVDAGTAASLQESFEYVCATEKQEPYADEDHEARKATLRFPADKVKFSYGMLKSHEGVIVTGPEPTSYGAESVNGKVYRSWSGEFATDADYAKASCKKNHWTFPDGVRGSESNPAHIIALNFVTGALTNKPAFKNMPPVKAKKAELEADTVKAKGTSEGVTKSWDTRRSELASHFGEASVNRLSAAVFKHDPTKVKEFAHHATEHAEAASKLVSEVEDGDKHFAHAIAANAHSEAAQANSHSGNWQAETHHHTQTQIHSRYSAAANNPDHPDHSRALMFRASRFDLAILETNGEALEVLRASICKSAKAEACIAISFADEKWNAVIKASDGKLLKTNFSIGDDESIKLGEQIEVNDAVLISARDKSEFLLNGNVIKAGAPIGNRNAEGRRTSGTNPSFNDQTRFNWGYHDAAQGEKEGWHTKENHWGFAKSLGEKMDKPEDIMTHHFDTSYAHGWLHGIKHVKEGKYTGNSQAAWDEHNAKFSKAADATPTPIETIFARKKAEQERINGIASKSPTLAAREAAAKIAPTKILETIAARKKAEQNFQERILARNPLAANREALSKIKTKVLA